MQNIFSTAPYLLSPDETVSVLGTNPSGGLTDALVEVNRDKWGENAFTKEKPPSIWKHIWDALTEPMILMLLGAAAITLIVNFIRYFTGREVDFWEVGGVFAAIFLSVVITVVMEGKSAKAFEELNRITQDVMIKVLRGGNVSLIPQRELVVGDIILMETGDRIPADARLLEAMDLSVNESSLTGESMPVKKNAGFVCPNEKTPVAERNNMLYSGCFVSGGSGKAVVTAVGDATEFGKIASELSHTVNSSTPLQEKMLQLGKTITILGTSAAAIVFIVEMILFYINGTMNLDTVSNAFVTSIVLIVAAVPEGLPTIVAVSLSLNIIKMSKQNALVKKMIACETIGCINVLCSDKTGTLTENRMTVSDIYTGDDVLITPEQLADDVLITNFCVNSTADLGSGGDIDFIGSPTEGALLTAAGKAGTDYKTLRENTHILHVWPFASETKNMTTVAEIDGSPIVFSKGSPEKILSQCRISSQEAEAAEQQILLFQEKAARVLAFAHKTIENPDAPRETLEQGMHFDGFAAIRDPLRPEVYESVKRCQTAGIDLKILTGDNIVTAEAIAGELGILEDGAMAYNAPDLETLSDDELADLLPDIRVIARSTPHIKMRVVKALKARGNVVALTGDGINDAPAIKNADVGIAMGISGTEVSKEASDIVLLDDSFSTIEQAVQWGRGIYENFQRFLQFQLTVNVSSVLTVLASILTGFAAPFTALQLLWVNIIMDGPPALTLGLEPIRTDLMKLPPTKRDAPIVTKPMLRRIFLNAIYVSILFMLQHWTNFLGGTTEQLPTILFTFFVVIHLFNAFNCRELSDTSMFTNFNNNRLMLGTFALTFVLQVVITQYGGLFYNTVPLSFNLWVKITLLGSTILIVNELAKAIERAIHRGKAKPVPDSAVKP